MNLYTCGRNIALHFIMYVPLFCLVFTGICGNAIVSSVIVCLIIYVSYALSDICMPVCNILLLVLHSLKSLCHILVLL